MNFKSEIAQLIPGSDVKVSIFNPENTTFETVLDVLNRVALEHFVSFPR